MSQSSTGQLRTACDWSERLDPGSQGRRLVWSMCCSLSRQLLTEVDEFSFGVITKNAVLYQGRVTGPKCLARGKTRLKNGVFARQ